MKVYSLLILVALLSCNKIKETVSGVTETKPVDPKEALMKAIEKKDYATAVKTFEISKKGEDAPQGNLRLTGLIKDLRCDEKAVEVELGLKNATAARLEANQTELASTTDPDARNVIESNITTNQMRLGILEMMVGKCQKKLGVAEEPAKESSENTESAAESGSDDETI